MFYFYKHYCIARNTHTKIKIRNTVKHIHYICITQ